MNASIEVEGSGVPGDSANAAPGQVTAEPTASANSSSNQEPVMGTSQSSTNETAEPTASATSSPNQEPVMTTTSTNPVPSNGAPNASASSGTTNPVPASDKPATAKRARSTKPKKAPALTKSGKPRKAFTPFDPSDVLKQAADVVEDAEGINDSAIIGDVTQVQTRSQSMDALAGQVRSTRSTAMTDLDNWEADDKKLEAAARPVLGVLRATDDGRTWVSNYDADNYTARVSRLSAALAGSGFVVPDQLLQPMMATLGVATASKQRYDAAQAAKEAAIKSYSIAKVQLESAIATLKHSLARYKATQRAPVVTPVTPPAPPPPELNGASPGSGTKAAAKSAKRHGNHARNGVNGAGH